MKKCVNNLITKQNECKKSKRNLQQFFTTNNEIFSLNFIWDSIKKNTSSDINYSKEINGCHSILETYYYQTKMKDIYLPINELNVDFFVKNKYILIYFKIHFKDRFTEQTSLEPSKTTFLLKELIHLYTNNYFQDSITFHAENGQIITIVNVHNDDKSVICKINQIITKLKSEEDYVFFTIAVSNTYSDVLKLNKVYNNLFVILKQRKLIQRTQLLTENSENIQNNKFYFPLEQIEQFTSLLINGEQDKCIRFAHNILDYNFKKEINNFYAYLLFIEIVNCCVRSLIKIHYYVPDVIDIYNIYSRLEHCSTIEEYKSLCENLVTSVISYNKNHKKEHDYIIEFIFSYIGEHYTEDVYVDLLAEKLNLTSSYLSKYFKDKLGINLSDYINNFRIKKAIGLLKNSHAKVKDIASVVGFRHISTFNRLFKKYLGYSPNEYKKIYKL